MNKKMMYMSLILLALSLFFIFSVKHVAGYDYFPYINEKIVISPPPDRMYELEPIVIDILLLVFFPLFRNE